MERPRRLRQNSLVRDLVSEVHLDLGQMIQPYFLAEGGKTCEPIDGFTEVYRWGVDALVEKVHRDVQNGVKHFLLFGATAKKDEKASGAFAEKGLVPEALRALKSRHGKNITLFTDVCLCAYTSHGHCGLLRGEEIDNDASLEPLAKMALVHAEAGADFVAPSDMMDGRIGHLREALDRKKFDNVGILAYTAKYASSYYGPFREAMGSAPKGDRATYQMDFRNSGEALRELRLDLEEGADIVMVKPALAYLDIIAKFREESDVPVAAYSVSGEYEMVKQLAAKGLVDEKQAALENLTAIRRAGAHLIITYYATVIAEKGWLR